MARPWIFVSPASRGIGLHLTRRLLKTTDLPVVASARSNLEQARGQILDGLRVDDDRLVVLEIDVTEEATISAAASYCKEKYTSAHLHLAFLIPGILHPEKSPAQVSAKDALKTFQINTLGPLLLAKHFLPFLPTRSTPSPLLQGQNGTMPNSAVMALMSARVGSISDNRLGGWYSYRASKSAVNSLAKSIDIYLQQKAAEKAICISMHPGTVKTDLSADFWGNVKEDKLFSPQFAAERLLDVVKEVGVDGRGRCWDWQGKEIHP